MRTPMVSLWLAAADAAGLSCEVSIHGLCDAPSISGTGRDDLTGNLQQVLRLWRLADPRRGWVAFKIISGKGLRGLLPLLLLIVLLTTFLQAFAGSRAFLLLFAAELALCALALWGHRIHSLQAMRIGHVLTYVLRGCLAMTLGAVMVVLGREGRAWRYSKTMRPGAPR